jgi:hypothetical protein
MQIRARFGNSDMQITPLCRGAAVLEVRAGS